MGQAKGRGRDLFYHLSRGGEKVQARKNISAFVGLRSNSTPFWLIFTEKNAVVASFTTHKYDALGALFHFFGAQKSEIWTNDTLLELLSVGHSLCKVCCWYLLCFVPFLFVQLLCALIMAEICTFWRVLEICNSMNRGLPTRFLGKPWKVAASRCEKSLKILTLSFWPIQFDRVLKRDIRWPKHRYQYHIIWQCLQLCLRVLWCSVTNKTSLAHIYKTEFPRG